MVCHTLEIDSRPRSPVNRITLNCVGCLPLAGEQARMKCKVLGGVCGRATRPYGRMKLIRDEVFAFNRTYKSSNSASSKLANSSSDNSSNPAAGSSFTGGVSSKKEAKYPTNTSTWG